MDPARTYIFVRLWEDFPPDLDISKFEGVLRSDFGAQLDRVAASWIRENLNGSRDQGIEAWAAVQPDADAKFSALIDPRLHESIGIAYLLCTTKNRRNPQPPQWTVIHKEPTLDRAHAVAETLEAKMHLGCRFETLLVEQRELKTPQWLGFERELEEWDAKHLDVRELGFGAVQFKSPLRRLREEAMKLSPHLSPGPDSSRPDAVVRDELPEPKSDAPAKHSRVTSRATDASNLKGRRGPPRVLGSGHRDLLTALEKAGATSLAKRLKGPQLAKKAFGGGAGIETIKTPAARLVKWGFAESLPGPEGGYWITPTGIQRLHAEER